MEHANSGQLSGFSGEPRAAHRIWFVVSVALLLRLLTIASPASAVPLYQLPFPCGETWYASSYYDASHGTNGFAIDFHATSYGSTAAGRPVIASNAGVVTTGNGHGYGNYIIVRDGGYASLYGHLSSFAVSSGATVAQGQTIGATGSSGTSSVHLHYEQWTNDFNDFRPSFNGVLTPYPLPGYATGYGITSQNCGGGVDDTMLGILDNSGNFWAKEGISGGWVLEQGSVKAIAVSDTMLGILDNSGKFWAKDGISGGWVLEQGSVKAIAVSDTMLGILDNSGNFWAKEGISGGWVLEQGSVKAIAVSDTMLGILDNSGNFWAKEGISGGWVLEQGSVKAIAVSDTMLGILDNSGNFWAKEGISGGWVLEQGSVKAIAVSDTMLGILDNSGNFWAKEGISGGWVLEQGSVKAIAVSDTMLGILDNSGNFWAKEGISGGWVLEQGSVKAICLPQSCPTLGDQTLTVTRRGKGVVTSSPSGIHCASTCSWLYPYNSKVSLFHQPRPGWHFRRWSGDCSGPTSCTLSMSRNLTVNATFVRNR